MPPRILIVDDNPTNLRLATDILEDAGCRIEQAVDAEQALTILEGITPDLILMDIALPGMDGLALTRKLKADPRFRDIPVVALTASAMKGDEERALAAGCRAYITKPIDTRRFGATIFGFLPAQAAPDPDKTVVMVVDDYASNRAVLRAGLELEGIAVLEASNGVEALEVLERERVDAVISDILMPSMDGFRLCHEIRKDGKPYAAVPFILYTATYNSPSDRQLAATVGADDYVVKPAPMSVIMESLRKARLQAPRSAQRPVQRPSDSYVLEQYSAALVRKLEERNTDLQQALATLQAATDRISDLNLHLEERVAQRTAELEAANRALDSFSHTVAHDLRGPLSHISLCAEALQETAGQVLNAAGRNQLDTIVGACGRMNNLITDLLAYARSGREELKPSLVELEAELEEALKDTLPGAIGRRVEWRRVPLPKVRGDRTMLRQVLVNLLSNALKYSRTRDPAVIEIGWLEGESNQIVIYVRDNGVGFDMQRAEELFKMFRRLHAGDEFEGTGIGLASAQQIIARHGGRMWAESAVDQGATFFFSLPPGAAPRARG